MASSVQMEMDRPLPNEGGFFTNRSGSHSIDWEAANRRSSPQCIVPIEALPEADTKIT